MHRLLRVPEILYMIFEFLMADNCERSTASAARTCRMLLEPALDLLWRDLDDFRVLIKLFPSSSLLRDDITKLYYRFYSPLRESDWQMFDRYAYRVKTLRADLGRPSLDGMETLLHETFCNDLGRYLRAHGRLELLPNLRSLRLYGTLQHCVELGVLLVTPKLHTLDIQTLSSHMDNVSQTLIKRLDELKPPLKFLAWPKYRSLDPSCPCRHHIPALIPSTITTLSVHDSLFSRPPIVQHICSLTSLEVLCIQSDYYNTVPWSKVGFLPFSSLKKVAAGRMNLQRILPYTSTVKEIVVVTLYDYETLDDEDVLPSVASFVELAELAKRHCPNLEKFEVKLDSEDPEQELLREKLQGMQLEWGNGTKKRDITIHVGDPEQEMCRG